MTTEVVAIILDDRDPWDQLPGESKEKFEKFEIFRFLGPFRTVPKAYRKWRAMQNIPSTTATSAAWYGNANKWRWQERANAWDDHVREQHEEDAERILNKGLALSHIRVEKLGKVAEKIETYLLDERT